MLRSKGCCFSEVDGFKIDRREEWGPTSPAAKLGCHLNEYYFHHMQVHRLHAHYQTSYALVALCL
jgi:hypothetical protein